jgi:Fibronectin type III domain
MATISIWRSVLVAFAATALLITGCGGGGSNPPPIPAAPAGVSATPGNTQVTVGWTAVNGATSYNIYWATSSGVTAATGTKIEGATPPYVHTGLTNDTTYYYVVTAVNGSGESATSAEVSAIPTATPSTAPYIQATVLTLNTGTSPFGWLQLVEVCSDASCNVPIDDATVNIDGTVLAFNATEGWYEGTLTIDSGATIDLSVTVNGTVYAATGTQFKYAPFITAPDPGATLSAGGDITISWLNFIPEDGSVYAVGILDSNGNFAYPAGGAGPKAVSISTGSDTVPAGTLAPGDYLVLVGTATPGIDNYTGGIPITNAGFGSGLWFVNVVSFNELTVQ